MYIFFSLYIFYYILVQKNQTTAGLLPDINLPAHHHGKETLSLREKPLCRRRAVCAGPRENRHSSVLGKASPAKHGARAGPRGSMCCCSDKHGEAPASAPSLQPRHSRAPLGPGSCCCFTQHCPAVTSHPSSCAGSSCSSACTEVRAQLHVWFRQWIHGRWGCEVPSTALAAVV